MLKPPNDINLFSFAKRINRPLILDGAMGSLLQEKGVKTDKKMWMSLANLEAPEKVLSVHIEYIKAGCDIITTNTFRTNPAAVENSNFNFGKLVKSSVDIAKKAVCDLPVLIAGSNAPAEDCYQVNRTILKRELEFNHKSHINKLFENGCHFILNETQSHFDEIKLISKFCAKENIPYVLSLFFTNKLEILSGQKLSEVIKFILDNNPLAIGFNCILPITMEKAFNNIKLKFNWGFYLNCGDGSFTDDNIKCGISPDQYISKVKGYLSGKPSFIGSCCGSSPRHIKKIKEHLDE